jgi:hypothetical protein
MEAFMHTKLTEFKNWLKCQYAKSSASVHYSGDLALSFPLPGIRLPKLDLQMQIATSRTV